MPGVYGILSIASRSMWASQTAVEVASHNIANMNTPGYSRQSAVIQTAMPVYAKGLLLGTGVNVNDIQAAQDRFLDYQLFNSSSSMGYAQARSDALGSIQEIFNESEDLGLSPAIARFFASMQDLASVPEGQAERVSLIGNSKVLANEFHIINSRLKDAQSSTDTAIKDQIAQINNIAVQIADLNGKIRSIEAAGATASDFRSTRTELLSQLGTLVDISSFENSDGTVNAILAGGLPLIEQNNVGKLAGIGNSEGLTDVYFQNASGTSINITDKIKGGKLAGDIQIRDTNIKGLMDKYDEMAYQLIVSVNTAHNAGFGLNGSTGVDFFAPLAGPEGAAAAIAVDPAVMNDVNNIAASLTGLPGDNQNALAMAQIEDAKLFNGGTWTFQDFHGSIIGDVGVEAQSAASEADHQAAMRDQVENLRESLVGVSLEDEMADIMKFQQAFAASARLFNVVSDMIDTLASVK